MTRIDQPLKTMLDRKRDADIELFDIEIFCGTASGKPDDVRTAASRELNEVSSILSSSSHNLADRNKKERGRESNDDASPPPSPCLAAK